MLKLRMMAIPLFAISSAAAIAGDASKDGQIAFNTHCRQCHSMKEGDNRLGPSLFGIVGAQGGQVEGFTNYSGSLGNITWDEVTLDKFIADPKSVVPHTTMIYPGLDDAAEREKIIEFLKAESNS